MKTLLAILLITAPLTLADAPKREAFPSDYVPHRCAPSDLCGSVSRGQIVEYAATLRAFDLDRDWLRKNWDDLVASMKPICDKVASCIATPGNEYVFCTDLIRDEFLATADQFPRESEDYRQWKMTALTYYISHFRSFRLAHKEAQACAKPTATDKRRLDVWMNPERIGPDYDGTLTIYAVDAETRVPIMAEVSFEGQKVVRAKDAPMGKPTVTYPLEWAVTFNRVPSANGHRDLVPPTVRVEAKGYDPVTFTMPVEVPRMKVEMTPRARRLRTGRNTITVTARDAKTGELVEARVMAGDTVLGETNKPLVLEIPRGAKRPEIWVTSLFDRYSDVVVARAGR